MKTTILSICILFSILTFAQENNEKVSILEKKHEVKVGAIKLLAATVFEGTYEYVHSKDFTYGASVLFNFQKDNEFPEKFSATPFARFYFQESKEYGANGFFVEGFGKIIKGNNYVYNNSTFTDDEESFTATAIGLSLGKKWINSSGFVFEILVGAGRRLGSSEVAPDAFFRGDLNIGYRF